MRVASFEVDLTRLPICTVVYPPSPTVPELHELFQMYDELSKRGRPIGYVIDFRQFDALSAPHPLSADAAQVFLDHAESFRAVTVCEARVVTSAISKGTLTSFDVLTGSKWPCANFTTLAEADLWVKGRLEKSGAIPIIGGSGSGRIET